MAHFYLQESLRTIECRPGQVVSVDGAEARHAVTVSRVRPGDRLRVGNGAGLLLDGTVLTAEAASLTLRVNDASETPAAAPRIRLVQALAKGDRDELAIQAATELGVDGVIPWSAARSITRWEGQKIAKGHERWSSIVREASKQSIRAWLPDVAPLVSTKQLAVLAGTTRMLLLDPTASARLTEVAAPTDDRDILLVVGPEGGISPAELLLLEQAGASQVRLGDTVLRTSTAGPAALAILNATLGRW
ncbi:16S rRNA (uracil(1498)-N(3))-methyltransferase [Cryobacterium sp. TMT1-3]|uniref:Ribosomal RNA small subunit methyltransferase E n=1 Tax=Cryobacterium luteum TaxID=1424661 RepID=A0A1H8L542_9MICO|nr:MULTISPECIES: 16S rRNA (uracil(1498)-N(3))-methyltransferase [Cryobacterium]TFB90105.1 16S rRNA (uracil(1498)-N(3))-methyltransferase [Cryobacterium luteum]TFC28389.1 16S rRNA (uracil(1498)-N(3))-methyltransferase [Cryobacterium sp. TMT1-3]SEO00235.1 16S rRNA (uracil1498-N3)-methyltransferase [Cryobacterium luteum]